MTERAAEKLVTAIGILATENSKDSSDKNWFTNKTYKIAVNEAKKTISQAHEAGVEDERERIVAEVEKMKTEDPDKVVKKMRISFLAAIQTMKLVKKSKKWSHSRWEKWVKDREKAHYKMELVARYGIKGKNKTIDRIINLLTNQGKTK